MITDFNEYTDGVLITVSKDQGQDGWRTDVPPHLYNFMHAIIGLGSELAEVIEALCVPQSEIDWVNVKEELGDLWWYIALAYDTAERSLPDDPDTQNPVDAAAIVREMYDAAVNEDGQVQTVEPMHLMVMINQLTVLAGEGMNVIKRRIYYFSDDSDPKAAWTKFDMSRALKTLTMLTLGCGFDPREVWRVNLLKLIGPNGRYKDSFDPERAVCRNLVKEREVLENG